MVPPVGGPHKSGEAPHKSGDLGGEANHKNRKLIINIRFRSSRNFLNQKPNLATFVGEGGVFMSLTRINPAAHVVVL